MKFGTVTNYTMLNKMAILKMTFKSSFQKWYDLLCYDLSFGLNI